MGCTVIDGGRTIIRSKPFIASDMSYRGLRWPPRGMKFTRWGMGCRSNELSGFNLPNPLPGNSSTEHKTLRTHNIGTVGLAVWLRGNALVTINRYSTPGPVNTWMGDCLRADAPSQYSLIFLRGRLLEYQPFWLELDGARSLP